MKRPPKPKAKTLSLSSPVGDPDELWLQEGDRRKLRPIVDSVFGQVGWTVPAAVRNVKHEKTKVWMDVTSQLFTRKRWMEIKPQVWKTRESRGKQLVKCSNLESLWATSRTLPEHWDLWFASINSGGLPVCTCLCITYYWCKIVCLWGLLSGNI